MNAAAAPLSYRVQLDGGDGADALTGGGDIDVIDGGPGSDTVLAGGSGNDFIHGGTGEDSGIAGGAGVDTLSYDDDERTAGVNASLISPPLGANSDDEFTSIEVLRAPISPTCSRAQPVRTC